MSLDGDFRKAGIQFLHAAEVLAEKWSGYKGGPSYPTMNPLKWRASNAHRKEIDEMTKSLHDVQRQFERLKPALLIWAERPVATSPPSERPPDDGRPKVA